MTPAQRRRAKKKANQNKRPKVKLCSFCGSTRHRAPGYLCRRYVAEQRRRGILNPLPSGKIKD